MRVLVAACVAMVLSVGTGWAADEPEPVNPDRAGATTSAETVGRGVAQLEAGLAYGRTRIGGSPTERRFTVETALRAGLIEQLELQVQADALVWLRGAVDETDHGDVLLGAKYRFLVGADDAWRSALALLPFVKLPVTEPPIGTGKTDFGALLAASFALPAHLTVDLNAGPAAAGQTRPGGYLAKAIASASLSLDVGEWMTLFSDVHYASRSARGSRDTVLLDAGVIWRPTRDVALDASGVTSLMGPGPDWTVRAGVSVRFGR